MPLEWTLAIIASIGLFLLFLGWRRLRDLKLLSGGLQSLLGLLLLAGSGIFYFIAPSLYTYHRYTHETPIADLNFKQVAPRQFHVLFTPDAGSSRVIDLSGDEWQLDARVLKWRALGTFIGLDGLYRLERLSGRYRDLERERKSPRTVHSLYNAAEETWDVWSLAQRYSRWLPMIDAVYGNAAYLPMADGAYYEVSLGTQGLIARPKNPAADRALREWR